MAVSDDDPLASLLARAGQALRELAEPGFERIADSVVAAVRTTPRSGWPLAAADPDTTGPVIPGGIEVSDLVLRGALARALRADTAYAPTAIDVSCQGADLQRICVEITGRYGSRLAAAAERVRATAAAVIDEVLGASSTGHHIDVVITDVVRGNPLRG